VTNELQSHKVLDSRRRGLIGWIVGGIVILLLIGLFVIPLIFLGGVARSLWGPGPYYSGAYYFPFFFPFGFLVFILIGFFVLRMIFWGWGWRGGYGRGRWGYGDAKEILRRRYARGEITKEQFDQMKKDIDDQS
jgi:putative membrane protein